MNFHAVVMDITIIIIQHRKAVHCYLYSDGSRRMISSTRGCGKKNIDLIHPAQISAPWIHPNVQVAIVRETIIKINLIFTFIFEFHFRIISEKIQNSKPS